MKKLLLLLAIITLHSCSSFKSGLTIPANETFILGESNSKNYSAELVNTSDYEVKISDEIIKFINNNNLPVKVNVKMSKEVYGMRYIKN